MSPLQSQPLPCHSALDDLVEHLVASHRGTWYAADPMTATGEQVWPEELVDDLDAVTAWVETYAPHIARWQVETLRGWFGKSHDPLFARSPRFARRLGTHRPPHPVGGAGEQTGALDFISRSGRTG